MAGEESLRYRRYTAGRVSEWTGSLRVGMLSVLAVASIAIAPIAIACFAITARLLAREARTSHAGPSLQGVDGPSITL